MFSDILFRMKAVFRHDPGRQKAGDDSRRGENHAGNDQSWGSLGSRR
jgi:hypothetical protein